MIKKCWICKREIKRKPFQMCLDGYYAHKKCWKKWLKDNNRFEKSMEIK